MIFLCEELVRSPLIRVGDRARRAVVIVAVSAATCHQTFRLAGGGWGWKARGKKSNVPMACPFSLGNSSVRERPNRKSRKNRAGFCSAKSLETAKDIRGACGFELYADVIGSHRRSSIILLVRVFFFFFFFFFSFAGANFEIFGFPDRF